MRKKIVQENLNWDELPFHEEVDPYYPTKMVGGRFINQFNMYSSMLIAGEFIALLKRHSSRLYDEILHSMPPS